MNFELEWLFVVVGSPEKLLAHLRQLACEAERRVGELGGTDEGPHSAPPYTSQAPDKTLALWERRNKGLKKMILGFEQARKCIFVTGLPVMV